MSTDPAIVTATVPDILPSSIIPTSSSNGLFQTLTLPSWVNNQKTTGFVEPLQVTRSRKVLAQNHRYQMNRDLVLDPGGTQLVEDEDDDEDIIDGEDSDGGDSSTASRLSLERAERLSLDRAGIPAIPETPPPHLPLTPSVITIDLSSSTQNQVSPAPQRIVSTSPQNPCSPGDLFDHSPPLENSIPSNTVYPQRIVSISLQNPGSPVLHNSSSSALQNTSLPDPSPSQSPPSYQEDVDEFLNCSSPLENSIPSNNVSIPHSSNPEDVVEQPSEDSKDNVEQASEDIIYQPLCEPISDDEAEDPQPQTLSKSHPTQCPSQIRTISRDPTPQEPPQSQTLSQYHSILASQIQILSQNEFQPDIRRKRGIKVVRRLDHRTDSITHPSTSSSTISSSTTSYTTASAISSSRTHASNVKSSTKTSAESMSSSNAKASSRSDSTTTECLSTSSATSNSQSTSSTTTSTNQDGRS